MVPLHERRPWQSPVWQAGLLLKLQPVLAQKRPLQFGGARTRLFWFGGRRKPPSPITGWPALGAAAGQIGKGHLFSMWNVHACPWMRYSALKSSLFSVKVTPFLFSQKKQHSLYQNLKKFNKNFI